MEKVGSRPRSLASLSPRAEATADCLPLRLQQQYSAIRMTRRPPPAAPAMMAMGSAAAAAGGCATLVMRMWTSPTGMRIGGSTRVGQVPPSTAQ